MIWGFRVNSDCYVYSLLILTTLYVINDQSGIVYKRIILQNITDERQGGK